MSKAAKNLRAAVKQMESTRAVTDPVRELRHWRLQAEKRFMARVVSASEARAIIGRLRGETAK